MAVARMRYHGTDLDLHGPGASLSHQVPPVLERVRGRGAGG